MWKLLWTSLKLIRQNMDWTRQNLGFTWRMGLNMRGCGSKWFKMAVALNARSPTLSDLGGWKLRTFWLSSNIGWSQIRNSGFSRRKSSKLPWQLMNRSRPVIVRFHFGRKEDKEANQWLRGGMLRYDDMLEYLGMDLCLSLSFCSSKGWSRELKGSRILMYNLSAEIQTTIPC